jgi:hypothetical protein
MATPLENPSEKHLLNRVAAAKWRDKNREKVRLYSREYYNKNKDQCNASTLNSRKKNPAAFILSSRRYTVKSRNENPGLWMYYSAKKRAAKKGYDFNLDKSDIIIPDVCPVFGIPLFKGYQKAQSDNSPNLDRIDNNKGYIKGNVMVISAKANRIKTNATAKEIRQVADWLDLVVGS